MNKLSFLKGAVVTGLVLLMSGMAGGATFAQGTTAYQPQSTFISPEKEAPMSFTGLYVKWHELEPENTTADFHVRFLTEDGWGKWNELHGDVDEQHEGEVDSENPKAFISTNKATKYQYKVVLQSTDPKITPTLENIEFTYIHAHDKSDPQIETIRATINAVESKFLASNTTSTNSKPLRVISRKEWGADENLRIYNKDNPPDQLVQHEEGYYEKYAAELKLTKKVAYNSDGKPLTWPIEYPAKISKIVIHHTATSKNLNNPKQAIRDIYYFHSISRGWGDIGYNYIIDQKGNIYEGRYGGDGVVGAHAGRANVGSIGIAVLGNYEENEAPEAVMSSLTALIKAKSAKYGIDTMGSSKFRGENMANVIGHRDVMSTSCPGSKLYANIPTLRTLAKNKFVATIIDKRRNKADKSYDYTLSGNYTMFEMDGGEKKSLLITIKNTGTKIWDKNTYIAVSNTKASQKYLAPEVGRRSAQTGKTIKPGNTAVFSLPLEAAHQGGFLTLEIFPMINGNKKLEKYASMPVKIKGSIYDYELVSVNMPKKIFKKGEKVDATVVIKNTGKTTWRGTGKNKVMLGTENPRDHISHLLTVPGARMAGLIEPEVKPNEMGHFKLQLQMPMRNSYNRLYFSPVVEGVTWMPDYSNYIEFYIADTSLSAKYLGTNHEAAYMPGEKKTVWLNFENTGRGTWYKTGSSAFKLSIAKNASVKVFGVELEQDEVATGETGRVKLTIQAPETEGLFRVIATPKVGSKNLIQRVIPLYVNVSNNRQITTQQVAGTKTVNSEINSNNIRIGLSFSGNPVISADGPYSLLSGQRVLKTYKANTKASVTYVNGQYKVEGSGLTYALAVPPRFEPIDNAILRIDNYENHPSWKPILNDNMYKGALEVHYYKNTLKVVNELAMEDYLKGLAEIDASQHFEKIKAIIVLARSYAKFYTGDAEKFPGAPFHLSDDPQRSQFYLGYGFEKRNQTGVKAVNATAGEVVVYNNKVIKTPYFSASDGRTRSAYEVWGWTNTPYLQSVDDPGCKGEQMRGHGVGLSGCGSLYWAEKGKNYKEIIKYYFKGVQITP